MANPNPHPVNIVNPPRVDITYPAPNHANNHANAIVNPDIVDPNIANPDIVNPDIVNPNIAIPDIVNIVNPALLAITFAPPAAAALPDAAVNNEPNARITPNSRITAEIYKAALGGVLQHGITDNWENSRTVKGNSILHIHVAVPVDVRAVNIRFLTQFLGQNHLLLNLTNDRRETPLHLAASFGQLEAVKLFTGRNLWISETNVHGDTALHMAAQNKHTSVVEHLCTLHQSLELINSRNNADETPLNLGVQSGSEDLVKAILNGRPEGSILPARKSILHAAIIWGNKDMVRLVTKFNYRELLQSTEHGQTPIHYAAGVDNKVLKAFLKSVESGTAVYIRDSEGRTAAHIAAQQNNVDGLKLLMKHFPDICEITDNKGRNIVHYSASLGHFEALDYFLSEIQFSDLVNKKDNGSDTPLHLLVKSLEELPIPLSSLKRLRRLIPKLSKLQVMSYNDEDKTPGDIASSTKFANLNPESKDALREIRMMAPKGGCVQRWIPPLEEYKEDIEAQPPGYVTNNLGTAAGSHMVVAALIATVSFTAGLTVPGGFNPENGPNHESGGTAILSHSKAFQAFLFTDCFALASSLTAILCYFWFVVIPTGKRYRQYLFTWAFRATSISIFMLMAAFLTGTYSFFQPSQKIAVVFLVLFLPVITFIFITFVISKFVVSIPGNQPKNNKLKWRVLHGHVTATPTTLAASSTICKWLIISAFIILFVIVVVFVILYHYKQLEKS